MNEYRIVGQLNPSAGAIPPFYQRGFLFNEYEQLVPQSHGRFYLLSAVNQMTGRADARCAFFLHSAEVLSPAAAPFGSIEFAQWVPNQRLDDLITSLVQTAQGAGATQIRLTNYPACYAPAQTERLTVHLLRRGFRLVNDYPTYFLPVMTSAFVQLLAPAQRRRLHKCQRAGFRFTHELRPNIAQCVAFLKETRRQKGYPLPIDAATLTRLLNTFPDQYPVFTVKDGETLIALSVTVRVRHDILYHFLPASHADYQRFSPMVLLTDGVYGYCQQHQISVLDLGVSLDHHRQPKPSLARFKHGLGAQESPKRTFERLL